MLEQPDLVRGGFVSARGEYAHRLERRQIADPPEPLDQISSTSVIAPSLPRVIAQLPVQRVELVAEVARTMQVRLR